MAGAGDRDPGLVERAEDRSGSGGMSSAGSVMASSTDSWP
jgi:hypothetical protein